jgi:hypothetical protein
MLATGTTEVVGLRAAYLDLLKRSLSDSIHQWTCSTDGRIIKLSPLVEGHPRFVGKDWPAAAETMVGLRRLDNVQKCIERVLEDNIAGDLIEAGVWRGGTTIFMSGVLEAYGVSDRQVYVADSFQGLPPPDLAKYPQDAQMILHQIGLLAVPLEHVRNNFQRYGLLAENVKFIPGFFKETLPQLHDRRWALIRLDGDMYESTMDGLVHLYPNLSPGGNLIIDDYFYIPACKAAVEEYRASHQVTEPLEAIDGNSVYWKKMPG